MSLLTKGIGLAKKAKHRFQDQIRERTPVYLPCPPHRAGGHGGAGLRHDL